MMEISVHDNNLHSYCVNADKREIRLHTSYAHSETQEFTDVFFVGVVAYRFEGDSFGTIISGIYETNAEDLYIEDKEVFEDGRKYGWPGVWNRSEESVLAFLIENDIKGYLLSVSIGMTGWVWAKSMSLVSIAG